MKSEDITGDLDLLGDWLDAKGYTEEAGLCTRAMDEINKLRERLAGYQKDADEYLVRLDELNALRAENARLQILLDGRDQFIVENGLWRQFVHDADGLKIRAEAARAAMGESDE